MLTRHRSNSAGNKTPVSSSNLDQNIGLSLQTPDPASHFPSNITGSVSISQEDIMRHNPASPRNARFAIQYSPEKPEDSRKVIKKGHNKSWTPSNLKVDANVLIKWGKGKDEEYRRGLLLYRVITLKRLIVEFVGADRKSSVIHRRMDVGTYDRDGPLGPKDAVKIMDSLGVVEEEYNCLMRDLQDLMLPDFEINLKRKLETVTRMQQTYKCFSTL